jgi:hypothetical protein
MKNINDDIALDAKSFFSSLGGRSLTTHVRKDLLSLQFSGLHFNDMGELEDLTLKIGSFIDNLGWDHGIFISNSGLTVELKTPKELQLPDIIVGKNTKEEIILHASGIRSNRRGRGWLHHSVLGVEVSAFKEKSTEYSGMTEISIYPVENYEEWGREDGFETLEEYLVAIQDRFMSRLSEFGSVHNPTRGYFTVS